MRYRNLLLRLLLLSTFAVLKGSLADPVVEVSEEHRTLAPFSELDCIAFPPLRVSPFPLNQTTPAPLVPSLSASQRGDTNCQFGDSDCNVCADSVENQFFDAFRTGGMSWNKYKWKFRYTRRYDPDFMQPNAVLGQNPVKQHVQGFVATNNSTVPYAISHSSAEGRRGGSNSSTKGRRGGYFFTTKVDPRNSSSANVLGAAHFSNVDHPLSVAEIGQFVISAEKNKIRVFDLRNIAEKQNVVYKVRALSAGGGLAVAKLADGAHMLVTTGPGARKKATRNTTFYRLEGPLHSPTSIELLNTDAYVGNSIYQYSDNLSLITECTTGQLYTIHTSGDEKILNRGSKGYWRLSRVDWDNGIPRLTFLKAKGQKQSKGNCHLRSAATVHVRYNNDLEFLCHGRNVWNGAFGLGVISEDEDSFAFRSGLPN